MLVWVCRKRALCVTDSTVGCVKMSHVVRKVEFLAFGACVLQHAQSFLAFNIFYVRVLFILCIYHSFSVYAPYHGTCRIQGKKKTRYLDTQLRWKITASYHYEQIPAWQIVMLACVHEIWTGVFSNICHLPCWNFFALQNLRRHLAMKRRVLA
jgi:hypothetical protein